MDDQRNDRDGSRGMTAEKIWLTVFAALLLVDVIFVYVRINILRRRQKSGKDINGWSDPKLLLVAAAIIAVHAAIFAAFCFYHWR